MNLKNVNWMKIALTATTVVNAGLTFATIGLLKIILVQIYSKKVQRSGC